MLAAGLAGCGVMQMPTWLVANALQEGRLVPLLEQWAGGEMPIHAVWPQSRFMQPRLRAVIDMLTVLAEKPGSGFNS